MKNSVFFIFMIVIIFCIRPYSAHASNNELFKGDNIDFEKGWINLANSSEERIHLLLEILSLSANGRSIIGHSIKKAADYGMTIVDVISEGSGSLTDTTLIRKFSKDNPTEMVYETRSVVYINRNLTVLNALLDLAHELTHFVFRETFNPYTADFLLADFIISTVEGRGGEVDAYLTECKVFKELFYKNFKKSKCNLIIEKESGEFSKVLAIKQFYRVGKYYDWFVSKTKYRGESSQFEKVVGRDHATFISSAYNMPYPVAAIKEFEGIKQKVCSNDAKRLAVMKSAIRRTVASDMEELTVRYSKAKEQHIRKCMD